MIALTWLAVLIDAPVLPQLTPLGWAVFGTPAAMLVLPGAIIETRNYFRQEWWRGP